MFKIVTKKVHGARGIEPAYDIEYKGKFVSRSSTKGEAREELARMERFASKVNLEVFA